MALSMLCSATQEIPRYELFTKILLTISTKQSFGDCQWATPANVEAKAREWEAANSSSDGIIGASLRLIIYGLLMLNRLMDTTIHLAQYNRYPLSRMISRHSVPLSGMRALAATALVLFANSAAPLRVEAQSKPIRASDWAAKAPPPAPPWKFVRRCPSRKARNRRRPC